MLLVLQLIVSVGILGDREHRKTRKDPEDLGDIHFPIRYHQLDATTDENPAHLPSCHYADFSFMPTALPPLSGRGLQINLGAGEGRTVSLLVS